MLKRPRDQELGFSAGKIKGAEHGFYKTHSDQDDSYSSKMSRVLFHKDYTIGWICAFSFEIIAAKAVLDEIHARLAIQSFDSNAYMLSGICGYNVVNACLPISVYGTYLLL